MLLWCLQTTGRIDQDHGATSRPRHRPSPMWCGAVQCGAVWCGAGCPTAGQEGQGGQGLRARRREPWQVAGWALVLHQTVGSVGLCTYKDMRCCPVKHFQDFPRSPKTLGPAAQQQNKLHLGTRKPTRCPTVCKSGAAREQGSTPWHPSIPTDWRWDSVSGLWNNRPASRGPRGAHSCVLFSGPGRIQRSDWRNPVA